MFTFEDFLHLVFNPLSLYLGNAIIYRHKLVLQALEDLTSIKISFKKQ